MLAINKLKHLGQHFRSSHPGDASNADISSSSSEPAPPTTTPATTTATTTTIAASLSVSETAISSSVATLTPSSPSSHAVETSASYNSSSSSGSGSGSDDSHNLAANNVAEDYPSPEGMPPSESTICAPRSNVRPFPSEENEDEGEDRVHKRVKADHPSEIKDTPILSCCLF